ncbi:MAG: TRAP transporter substrate-binding protein [Fusobacterium gastrosuis]|uniref:TRAP transporter substrate-binding protein n=1 Tax=Fusobacterium gastrosuis TaxID=1755100 RepID=UPI002A8A4E9B|nr:TRAP transporter substrate-binding protein [Fusobacterium gastrosuis]
MKKMMYVMFLVVLFGVFEVGCKKNKVEDMKKSFQIGFTTAAVEGDPYYVLAKNFSELVNKKSEGKIKIEIKGGGQLGQEGEMFTGMQIGTHDMAIMTNAYVSAFVPAAGLFDLPFIFKDSEEAARILDSELGTEVLKEYEKFGVKGLAYGEGGFRHLVTLKTPVREPKDFKGLKIRCMETENYIATYSALGTNAVPMAWSETITGLQQGTIDGLDIPISVIYTNGFPDIAKNLNLTGHFYSPLVICISKNIFDGLNDNEKNILIKAAKEAGNICRAHNKNSEGKMLNEMEAQGMEIIRDVDKVAFQTALKDFYSNRAKNIGGDYVEKLMKKLK